MVNLVDTYIKFSNRYGTYYVYVKKQFDCLIQGKAVREILPEYNRSFMFSDFREDAIFWMTDAELNTLEFITEDDFITNKKRVTYTK